MNKSDFGHIFEPLQVRNMTLKNRIVMTPMGTNYGSQSGEISNDHIHYYELRARGGTGLIIVENIGIDYPLGSNGTTQIRIDHDSFLPQLYKLTESVHNHGACIAVQINHAGASAMSSRTGMQPVSASNIPSKDGGELPRPLLKEEIQEIVKKYGQAARRAQIAGFDSVEIHAGHSYLISQFLSPLTNKREDEFGGSIENRSRFAKMVVEEVRSQVGPGFPIIMRVSADEFLAGGNTLEDTLKYLEFIGEEVDIFDVSAGLNGSIHKQIDASYYEDGWRSYMAKAVKAKFNKPCMAMGNVRDPKAAEDILARGDADLIGIGRGLIADPDWVNKTAKGNVSTIRKCISCNIGCAGNRIGNNRPIRCTVNPSTLSGEVYKKQNVSKPCNVVIIGGGTAGLEAACTAAEVGCQTFLIEKEKELGGLALQISKIPEKKRLADFPNYMIQRAKNLKNLSIFTETEPTVSFIQNLHPDIIVNATGSTPLLPPIKGLHERMNQPGGKVASITHMIENIDCYGDDLTGKKIVVIGGGAVGLDVVEFFAPRGADVSIVEMMPIIGNGLDPVSKVQMTTMMTDNNVTQLTNTALLEVKDSAFSVKNPDGTTQDLDFDYGFVCLGMKAYSPVYDSLALAFGEDVTLSNIGDSVRARRIIEGVHEGRNILNILEREGYL
ncbi:2,4-dienoyl-CoA reductase-like NADH-dependent reductase (Old Yellow Enzyme family)/thioredoxin reductase [Aequitasia blattaphilus]|uniref:NAD(P)/FAD-dependent oxidoreductase n=1 Tax=Aequitasia blattaphilus TaxID=2949332 RepID=A0ABT1E4S5_9FIRM|nr:NAD(P)/FAD-dependent oxidoreductase [Aequitasia blattaphilus]MCP1100840.1 NAD(P)/FAD-dependent oxidoreductase [Aequitasia blattaphilus]MCR8613480.1 NAD(P)/FAD-dependent oxidoreductase [Aequitasia blattaphilus]